MNDVRLQPAVIGIQNLVVSWAGQDLETQAIGVAVPFTFSFETGFVFLGFDFITFTPNTFNHFDSQNLESFSIGPISVIPLLAAVPLSVQLLEGDFTSTYPNDGGDDLESYPIGAISYIKSSFSNNDVAMNIGYCNPSI